MEWALDRRHVATAGRADAHRPFESSDRARCRYLVHAYAGSRAVTGGTRVQHGIDMVAKDRPAVDPKVWTYGRTALVLAAAQDPAVARIFVNPAIKKAMCREAEADRSWLSKVRPWWGHDEHFHVRIACPPDSP